MGGIAGIIRFDDEPVAPAFVERMTSTMRYRGTDDINHWHGVHASFGHCMLHTTPQSLEDEQPATNEAGSIVLVMDGRVDNWEELSERLAAHRISLRNRSDAELVLRAYELWGSSFVEFIEGDFALVLWNEHDQKALCLRDRVGNKPFHYHWNGRVLAFASDLNAILALPWISAIPNEGYLAEILANEWLSCEETFWTGISRLAPAHQMLVTANGLKTERYWEPDYEAKLRFRHEEEYVEYYRWLLSDVVRRMSRSHLPVAYTVSGGLDSSAIFAVANRLLKTSTLPAPAISGYVTAFYDDPKANELEYIHAVGTFLDRPIVEVPPAQRSSDWYRETARRSRDMINYPNAIMNIGTEERMRQDGNRVQVSGLGGDEWLGGSYYYYSEDFKERQWQYLFKSFRTEVKDHGFLKALEIAGRHGLFPLLPESIQSSIRARRKRPDDASKSWLSPAMQDLLEKRRRRYRPEESSVRREKTRQFAFLTDPYFPLVKERQERRNSMLGLEFRNPFYDPRIIQFAISTPERVRRQGSTNKLLHRQAMVGWLPDSVVQRRTKAEFSVVFQHQLGAMEKELVETIPQRRREWVAPLMVDALYREFQRNCRENCAVGGGYAQAILWNLFACDAVYDGIE